jgi:phenylacetate-coenzyme A ligase PaaK-like adenylate-forming protein
MGNMNRMFARLSRITDPDFVRFRIADFPDRMSMSGNLALLQRYHLGQPHDFQSIAERLLVRTARYAFHHSPYYRESFLEHGITPDMLPECLNRVPILDKATIRREGKRVLAISRTRNLGFFTTGGSTGEPQTSGSR